MNKEIYHEGWLTKSPPTNRIWRGARWRRRWFTLKQGELPGQFFLEYYTDRNCRKLKGTIDLDQCEQVDAGLHLEKGKLKFQHMFDVKTPRRTYYLAADSENDMKEWVNCICQVCALQDLSQSETKNYYNINSGTIESDTALVYSPDRSNDTQITELNSTINNNEMASLSLEKSTYHTVNNKNLSSAQQTTIKTASSVTSGSCYNDFYNKELLLCKVTLQHQQPKGTNPFASTLQNSEGYTNFNISNRHNTIERSQGIQRPIHEITGHTRTQSLSESKNDTMSLTTKTINKKDVGNLTGTVKKIPKSLMLTDRTNFVQENSEPSPSLSTCSGPYISISECYSGSPVYHNNSSPTTPLNSLDPKFYDTPRSHINIGLNLTDQPYSPKRNNCQQQASRPRSGRSSPTDSESVFTDDEWTHPMSMGTNTLDRNLRPSDSSVENDSIGLVLYTQRFSKIPTEILNSQKQKNIVSNTTAPPRPPKRISGLVLDGIEYRNKDTQSDTENASPAIGPKEVNSSVEQSYDIPRSHQPPYFSTNNINSHTSISPTLITTHDIIASSTPNLIINDNISSRTLQRNHFYTNAAPSKIERNVFRYDFMEQSSAPAPVVDRTLKPKIVLDCKPLTNDQHPSNFVEYSNKQLLTNGSVQKSPILTKLLPPPLDRKPKPATPRFDTNSLRRKGGPITSFSSSIDGGEEFYGTFIDDSQISIYEQNNKFVPMSAGISPTTPSKSDDKLQYCDLDHTTSSPQKMTTLNKQNIQTTGLINNIINNNNILNNVVTNNANNGNNTGGTLRPVNDRGVVYKTVDFLKTEAFNRTRQDAEENRKNNK